MKIQLQAHALNNNDILRAAGVKRIHDGWYTVHYNGVKFDKSTIIGAKRNHLGRILFP